MFLIRRQLNRMFLIRGRLSLVILRLILLSIFFQILLRLLFPLILLFLLPQVLTAGL